METDYINSGELKATDKNSILASKESYELKLRVLLNLKFRYAKKEAHYNPSLSFLISHLDFIKSKKTKINLQIMTKIIESFHEVEKVDIERFFEGRNIIDAIFKIYPTNDFISIMIENNKAKKRTETDFLGENYSLIIEPMRSDFVSGAEFKKAKREYDINKSKELDSRKKDLFN